jgi:hypothetical protein
LSIFSLIDVTNVGDIAAHNAHHAGQCYALVLNGCSPRLGFEVMLAVVGGLLQVFVRDFYE